MPAVSSRTSFRIVVRHAASGGVPSQRAHTRSVARPQASSAGDGPPACIPSRDRGPVSRTRPQPTHSTARDEGHDAGPGARSEVDAVRDLARRPPRRLCGKVSATGSPARRHAQDQSGRPRPARTPVRERAQPCRQASRPLTGREWPVGSAMSNRAGTARQSACSCACQHVSAGNAGRPRAPRACCWPLRLLSSSRAGGTSDRRRRPQSCACVR